MNRRTAIRLLATLFLTTASLAQAQQVKKLPRIGYLSALDTASEVDRSNGLRLALRERGYTEGQNIATEYRYAAGKLDRLPELAAELVRLKVDVIVVSGGDRLVRAAMNATSIIPIVMMGAGVDPVEAGLVKSIARPGGNVTGFTNLATVLGGKRLELLKEALPKIVRVAVLYSPTTPSNILEVKELLPTPARELRLTLQPRELRAEDSFEKIFAALNKDRPHGLYVLPGPRVRANQELIAAYAIKNRLPTVASSRRFIDAGGLMSYGADQAEGFQRTAYFVDRILTGTKPADLPVEQPMKFEFIINLQTAKKIGVTIPQSVLFRATKVIQ
jgi:putative ABC transport system substrate-binding protein